MVMCQIEYVKLVSQNFFSFDWTLHYSSMLIKAQCWNDILLTFITLCRILHIQIKDNNFEIIQFLHWFWLIYCLYSFRNSRLFLFFHFSWLFYLSGLFCLNSIYLWNYISILVQKSLSCERRTNLSLRGDLSCLFCFFVKFKPEKLRHRYDV